jgi:ABC-type uncharacterized transport system involved in gliding motility auxiliary subunit
MAHLERRLALVCAVLGVLLLFAGVSFVVVEGGLVPSTSFTLIAGVALLIAYAVLDPRAAGDLIRSRRARFGSLSVVISAIVIGILVAVNVLGSHGTAAADLTKARLYTLSPKSVLVTKKLSSDLVVTGFYRPDEQQSKRDVQTLLGLYRQQSPHVKPRFVDADQNSALAQRLGVTIPGSIVLQYKEKPPVVLSLASQSESDVTAAILRLEASRSPVVCWAAGDGERNLKQSDAATGYSAVADLLRTSNYQVQDVLIAQQGVPSSCEVLALVGVIRPLGDSTVAAIGDYLNGGGKLLLAVDPWLAGGARVLATANAVLKPYGVSFDGGLVVEGDTAHSATNDPTVPVAFDYGQSPITKDLARKYVFLPSTTSISGTASGSATSVNLITSTDKAYEIAQSRDNVNRQAADKAGPFTLMQTIEQKRSNGKLTRIVLSGTSSIAENRAMPPNAGGSNPDLILGSVDWLSQQDALIAINPKPSQAQPLSLSDRDLRFNQLLTLLVLPGLVVAAGLVVMYRRRRPVA